MSRLPSAAIAAVLVSIASGCGGSSGHAVDFPAGSRADFVTRCSAQPDASAQGCGCVYDELAKRIPYQRFATEGPVIASGGEISGPDVGAVQAAATTCAARIESNQGG
ncbi:MAG TPA: hypothetical protein VMT59_13485 [Gaiellaceae bacterium]|nr:hypothetical protein [Gaiellaceae bacterium]